jgi:hypothetical protein
MKIAQRRVHIAGSASNTCNTEKLKYAHQLVSSLSDKLLQQHVSLCAQVGKEPLHTVDQTLPTIFDWTVIQSIYEYVETTPFLPEDNRLLPLTTIMTDKTISHIPDTRKRAWQTLLDRMCVNVLDHPKSWTSGAVRRDRIAVTGDVLVLLSGGEGVEHLAQLYIAQKKPVIAFDLDLGASTEQGSGRAVAINRAIASHPQVYITAKRPETIGALWENISTRDGTRPIEEVVTAVLTLLEAIEPPTAFCVRLLNPNSASFHDVEAFFSDVVKPLTDEMDYRLVVSPQSPDESRWLNEQIFSGIHDSGLVIVDLTEERPNCLIELGYALGRNRRVLICAQDGTKLPFDVDKIECFFWSSSAHPDETIRRFRGFVNHNLVQAPLVPTTTLF